MPILEDKGRETGRSVGLCDPKSTDVTRCGTAKTQFAVSGPLSHCRTRRGGFFVSGMSDSQVGTLRRPRLVAHWRLVLARAPLSGVAAEMSAILLLCPAFLYMAAWNRFPFVFFDTGAYVLEGFAKVFVPERSAVYSLFLHYVHGRQNLWYVAIVQSLMTAFVVTEFARALRPKTTIWKLLGISLALSIFTSVAWYVGQIEPDCMTAVLVMALYPLAFRLRQVGWPRAALLVAVAAFAIGAHPSHLGLAAGLVMCLALVRLAGMVWRYERLPKPNIVLPALVFVLGLGSVLVANYSITHKIFVSKSGSIFLTARLMGDGVVKETLDEICPAQSLDLCAYKDRLPPSADAYLWAPDSPFNKLGRFYGDQKQYGIIVRESLERHPIQSIATGLWDSFRQLLMFRTGDGVAPQEWVLVPMFRDFMPKQYRDYMSARQQRGSLRFNDVNVVHYPLAVFSQVWLLVVLIRALRRRRWNLAVLPAFLLLAFIGNALVCGMFSGPHDRYQSRLVWVATLTVLLTTSPRLERALRAPANPALNAL
ncbi:MAG: hypothetical protein KGJ78_08330 [Alphaproteobacteria bacterium]|nr:hypothetical protein [Alphaproteobacteria bacterium]